MTAPHVGNYGVAGADAQAPAPQCSGVVMRSLSRIASNWRHEARLEDYLKESGVVALSGVDTRRLTRHLRSRGAMPMALGTAHDETEIAAAAARARPMDGRDLVSEVTTNTPYDVPAREPARGRIVAYDFGIKGDILGQLAARGLDLTVVPSGTSADDVLGLAPDGVFLSNGPGDPEPLTAIVDAIRSLLGRVPVFGICLGHQLLGLAMGARTFKLGFGHHGGNHPVRNLTTGEVLITAQNHGFAVDLWPLDGGARPARSGVPGPELLPARVGTDFGAVQATHQNLNDGTLEGLSFLDVPAFGVQFHPEAAPGPRDATGLFDRFVDLMGLA
jgi:carbamoyl-phosphate synthase small subunit